MNAQATSHRHFHDELSELKVALLNMSGEAQAALAAAVDAVLQRDGEKARDVIAGDREIDNLELEVEETVIRLLATQQPMARDLRFLTAAMKISNDLERVGDHAVNIAQSAERLLASRPIVPEPELLEMARQARTMLADALDAFVRGDAQAGRAICRRDDSVDALHASMFRILLTHMMEDPHIIGTAMELFLVSRNLERVADLATNIAEDVVFLVEANRSNTTRKSGLSNSGSGNTTRAASAGGAAPRPRRTAVSGAAPPQTHRCARRRRRHLLDFAETRQSAQNLQEDPVASITQAGSAMLVI